MVAPHLIRIAYVSALRSEPSRLELDAMLSTWRRQNARNAVTGFVVVHRDSVFQVLEGFPDVVQALYETISHDLRHHFVAKLIDEPILHRSFGDWSLGHARMVRSDLATLEPLRAFLDPAFRCWHCDEPMARTLLDAFMTGAWRRAIS
jgi:hypothetical protein